MMRTLFCFVLMLFYSNCQSQNTPFPYYAQLISEDIPHFWKAFDLAQSGKADTLYQQFYFNNATPALRNYLQYEIRDPHQFVTSINKKKNFYTSIRPTTLSAENLKPEIISCYARLKKIYPDAIFPDVYFIISNFKTGITTINNAILVGIDQFSKTAITPVNELSVWESRHLLAPNTLVASLAHELVHFQQKGLDTGHSVLQAVIKEGMADFIGELVSGKTNHERLHNWTKGREMQLWRDFVNEMYQDKAANWIDNPEQETADRPADIGYWVGYEICMAYYETSSNKIQAMNEMLHIKDYRAFYEKSNVEQWLRQNKGE